VNQKTYQNTKHTSPYLSPNAPKLKIWWNSPKRFTKYRAQKLLGHTTDKRAKNIMRPPLF